MIDIMKAIEERHSVRSFTDETISAEDRAALEDEVKSGNATGKLHMKLVWDEPEAFDSTMAHYGKFSNVRNYLIIAGPAGTNLEERGGYYGQRVALLAQQLGLNTCWVALTFKKRYVRKLVGEDDKLVCVVALGHGTSAGTSHKVKDAADVVKVPDGMDIPDWFIRGVDAALLAPTALNQQKFRIELIEPASDEKPRARIESTGGAYSNVDLGIARLHFELGAGTDAFKWADAWSV